LLALGTGILYITSIKREVHSHGERLQRAHQNDSVRGQDMLKRLEKMEAHIEKLGGYQSPKSKSAVKKYCPPFRYSLFCIF
jgi:TolA-binding protein